MWLTLAAGQREPRAEPYWSVRQAVEVGMKTVLAGDEHEAVTSWKSLLRTQSRVRWWPMSP